MRNVGNINVTHYILKFIDKTFFFYTIFDDILSFILNKFLINNDVNH